MKKLLAVSVLSAVLATGCASTGQQNGTAGGALLGGALGAILGNAADCQGCALIGGLIGAGVGGYTGNQIGRRMDQADAQRTQQAVHTNHTGQTTAWTNPDTRTSYDVTPVKTYKKSSGQACREVVVGEKTVGGKRQEVYTTACYDGAGGWEVQ